MQTRKRSLSLRSGDVEGVARGRKGVVCFCPPALLSQQLLVVVVGQVPPGASGIPLPVSVSSRRRLPPAAYPWHCTFNLANVQIIDRTFKAPRFLFKFEIIIIIKRQQHCISIAFFFCIYENSVNSLLGASGIQLSSG